MSDRTQQVAVGASTARQSVVTSSVPQGSVLGATLFTIYINELPKLVQSKCILFADDAKLLQPIATSWDCATLQTDLDNLTVWSTKWLLRFNADKCKVIHSGMTNPGFEYTLVGANSKPKRLTTSQERHLGVIISRDLKATAHCRVAAKRGMVAVRSLKLGFANLMMKSFKSLYTSYVRPHLDYCLPAIGPLRYRTIISSKEFNPGPQSLCEKYAHFPMKKD